MTSTTGVGLYGNGSARRIGARARIGSMAGLPAIRWLVTCRGTACLANARAWREQRLLGPFNLELAPKLVTGGYFLGDYMGQAAAGNSLLTLTTATTMIPGNQQNEYFQRASTGW